MFESRLISIDPGKYATKAIIVEGDKEKRISFRTKIYKLNNSMDVDAQGRSFKIGVGNDEYIIGDQGEEIDYSVDKANISHKLAIYTSIAQLLGDFKAVKLVIGCPTSIYKNKELRQEYKNYILNNGAVKCSVDNKPYSFLIENILVLPEGSGVVYTKPELFKNTRVAVIDLGGLNMNFTIYDNLIPQLSSMFTTNQGSVAIEKAIVNELGMKYGVVLSSGDAFQIIRQGGLKVKGEIDIESTKILDRIFDDYMVKLMQEIKKNNFNLDVMDVVFIGGTSQLVEDKILHHLPHANIVKNPQWANVEGFYKVGELKYAKKNR